ncbi:hypothetical protein EMIT0111MI5_170122 [Burkholderia sp. IT-111MI5]
MRRPDRHAGATRSMNRIEAAGCGRPMQSALKTKRARFCDRDRTEVLALGGYHLPALELSPVKAFPQQSVGA